MPPAPVSSASALPAGPHLFRLAGALYLVIILCGITAEGVIRGSLIQPGNPAETARTIGGALPLWRLGLVLDTAMVLSDLGIALVFLRLLAPAYPRLAPIACGLRLVQAGTIVVALAALSRTGGLLQNPDAVMRTIAFHARTYDIGLIFFAGNCLLMAWMLRPLVGRGLAWALAGSGLVYLAGSLSALVAPALNAAMQPAYLLPLLAETALCLWLLRRGFRRKYWPKLRPKLKP